MNDEAIQSFIARAIEATKKPENRCPEYGDFYVDNGEITLAQYKSPAFRNMVSQHGISVVGYTTNEAGRLVAIICK